jgi:hypothetical protein
VVPEGVPGAPDPDPAVNPLPPALAPPYAIILEKVVSDPLLEGPPPAPIVILNEVFFGIKVLEYRT